jgi:hypothetical protein
MHMGVDKTRNDQPWMSNAQGIGVTLGELGLTVKGEDSACLDGKRRQSHTLGLAPRRV